LDKLLKRQAHALVRGQCPRGLAWMVSHCGFVLLAFTTDCAPNSSNTGLVRLNISPAACMAVPKHCAV
jgi:hypothetical protein